MLDGGRERLDAALAGLRRPCTADPQETLADIRAAAAREPPGVRIPRRLFRRYALVYDAPNGRGGA